MLVSVAVILFIVACYWFVRSDKAGSRETSSASTLEKNVVADVRNARSTKVAAKAKDGIQVIDDDGKTLWVSPTQGLPLDLGYLPPGCQIIIALNWRELFQHQEGIKLVNALFPHVMRGLDLIGNGLRVGGNPFSLPRMLIGLHVGNDGAWLMSRVAYHKPFSKSYLEWLREASFEEEGGEHRGRHFGIVGPLAYYFPDPPHADRCVVVPKSLIGDVIDLNGNPPPLRRDMERLLAHTDADRIVTVLFIPNALFSHGESIFQGEFAQLRDPLFWFLGDEFSAAALSLHWDENFFIELIATPALDTSPERAARNLMERLTLVPSKMERYIASLEPQPYGREIILRFPAMVRTMVAYTRSGFDADHVVLRCYLPATAGHNLLMGAKLTLAERPAAGRPAAKAASP